MFVVRLPISLTSSTAWWCQVPAVLMTTGLLLDRPFYELVDLMFFACFFLFFSQLTFSDVCKPTFSKLFHMMWLYPKKKRCHADFLKVPPNKNEGRKCHALSYPWQIQYFSCMLRSWNKSISRFDKVPVLCTHVPTTCCTVALRQKAT